MFFNLLRIEIHENFLMPRGSRGLAAQLPPVEEKRAYDPDLYRKDRRPSSCKGRSDIPRPHLRLVRQE